MELEGSGLVAMMEAGAAEDLGRMYVLFRCAAGGHDALRAAVGAHIHSSGKALVQAYPFTHTNRSICLSSWPVSGAVLICRGVSIAAGMP